MENIGVSLVFSTPYDHFVAGPYRRMGRSALGRISNTRCGPTIGARVVPSACVGVVEQFIEAAPDDHLAASPHCGVIAATSGHVGRACSGPTIRAGGLYLPPVCRLLLPSYPPQTIISLPVQAPVCKVRASGALVMFVAVQLLVPELYLPPVLNGRPVSSPPQTIISLPVQMAV